MTKTAVILAGGLGTRLRSVITDTPKPMAPINGTPFLAYLIRYWIGQGIERFVLATGYLHEKIMNYFGDFYEGAVIDYSIDPYPLGTGGALIRAGGMIDDDFIFINGDTYFEVSLAEMVNFTSSKPVDLLLGLVRIVDPTRYMSVGLESDGRVSTFDCGDFSTVGYSNGGIYLVKKRYIDDVSQYFRGACSFEKEVLPQTLSMGANIYGYFGGERFVDIGTPSDYDKGKIIITERCSR